MTDADVGRLQVILGRMRAFQQNLPDRWSAFPDRYAHEYQRLLEDLERAGFDTKEFHLPAGAITRREVERNYVTHERGYLPPQIDRTVLMSAVGGVIAFVEEALRRQQGTRPAGPGPITITRSNVNLGTIHGDMNAFIQIIDNRGQADLAQLIATLARAIPSSTLSAPEKNEASDLADNLTREIASRPPGRLSAAVRPVAAALSSILAKSADLAQIWQAIEPHLHG